MSQSKRVGTLNVLHSNRFQMNLSSRVRGVPSTSLAYADFCEVPLKVDFCGRRWRTSLSVTRPVTMSACRCLLESFVETTFGVEIVT